MKHLIDIHEERCIGCTRCMRTCPTEAIRIINNRANLIQEKCIYCGNCITSCHKNAYRVTSDSFANFDKHHINVAILPLAIFGMFNNIEELQGAYNTLYNYGFDEIFDLSYVMELLHERVIKHVSRENKTYILSSCPSVVRLIQLKYPSLIDNLLPFDYPFEIGAKIARRIFSEKYQVDEDQIGISYISECFSNYATIKDRLSTKKTAINHLFLYNDIFRRNVEKSDTSINISKMGIRFATVGAYQKFNKDKAILAVDSIGQVDEVLHYLYLNRIPNVKLIEAYSCIGGCIGGNFTVINPFVAKWNISEISKQVINKVFNENYGSILDDQDFFFTEEINPIITYKLGADINQSLLKMTQINEILAKLPNIDCCACGSPSCRALAEDIVNGLKSLNDCHILRKE
ncbi:MAG TPA: [Fe-Fe] hydrogenase large subunit C-terminal domain-containing protein [Haloplasmataceae bacterium]